MKEAQRHLGEVLNNLEANEPSLMTIGAGSQLAGRRISTGFVEGTINRLVGQRMCKGQQMRWTRAGAHAVLQVRAAILNGEFDALCPSEVPEDLSAPSVVALVPFVPPFLTLPNDSYRGADDTLDAMRQMMERLKLPANEDKTHLCRIPRQRSTSWATPSGDATHARTDMPTSAPALRGSASDGWWPASARSRIAAGPFWMPTRSWGS